MKLRLLGNSVRLRLRKSEVAQFGATGRVSMTTDFGPGRRLEYVLESAVVPTVQVEFTGEQLTVRVPEEKGREWALGDAVSMLGRTETLAVLVEKDFVRTAVPEDDDFDRYANPRSRRVPPSGYAPA